MNLLNRGTASRTPSNMDIMKDKKRALHRPSTRASVVLSGVIALLFSTAVQVFGDDRPLSGPQTLIVYDSNRNPVQRIANIPLSTSCSNGGEGLFALAESRSKILLITDQAGSVVKSTELHWPISQLYGDKEGFIVVHTDGYVSEVGLDGTRRGFIQGRQIANAIRHPLGGIIGTTLGGSLISLTWGGDLRASYDSATVGRQVFAKGVSLEGDASVVTFDSVSKELVTLGLDLRESRRVASPLTEFSLFQSSGSHIAVGRPEESVIHFIRGDGSKSSFKTPTSPFCAGTLAGGKFYVGYSSSENVAVPTGAYLDFSRFKPAVTWECLAMVVASSLLFSLLVGWVAQRLASPRLQSQEDGEVEPFISPSAACERHSFRASVIRALLFALAITGLWISYWIYPRLRSQGSLETWGYYYGGALLSAVSLIWLQRFQSPLAWAGPLTVSARPLRGNRVIWPLFVVATAVAVLANYLNHGALYPKAVIALWIAAQVWFVMSFASASRSPRWKRWEGLHVLTLGAVAAGARLVKMGGCPADISFDFGIISDAAYRAVVGDWNSLFTLDGGQTIGRIWALQLGLAIWFFGLHDWVLCVPSLLWAVGFVLGAYLLGRELISHRFGLICGLLVAFQHNLLSYSRLPYVTESTAPFIFCLYFVVRGVRRGTLRDWALGGVWAGVSMMTVRQFTTFPFIGLALLLFMCVAHAKTMWRFRYHILTLFSAALVTFSPWDIFYLNNQHLSYRLSGTSPLLWGYKLNPNISLWISQFQMAFGGILRYPDRISWPSEAFDPTCLAITGSLFGSGLLCLLYRWRSLCAPTILIPMAGSIALGSAFLDNPPSYYHQFVGILLVMFVVAVPIECISEFVSSLRLRLFRWPLLLGVAALVLVATFEQVSPFLRYCQPITNEQGEEIPSYSINSFFSRYMLEHHDRRFVGVASADKPFEWGHPNISIFYGQFSERHEIRSSVSSYLPLRATLDPHDVDFIFRAENVDGLAAVKRVYPTGTVSKELVSRGQIELLIYTVPYSEVVRVYESSLSSGDGFDRAYFSLSPVT